MLIGNGLIAKNICHLDIDDSMLIHAAGVSDSNCTDEKEYLKDRNRLLNSILVQNDRLLIYFSTCRIYDKELEDSCYTRHKIQMEKMIQQNSSKYLIFRLPNVIGKTGNKSNLINFLADKIKNHQQFQLWTKARRRIIDIKDVVSCIKDYLLTNPKLNSIINLAPAFDTEVIEIIIILEQIYKVKARFIKVDKGNSFQINIEKMRTILDKYGLVQSSNYVEKVVKKYYE